MPPALELARRYSEALAILRAVHDFDDWLGEHWHDRCPPPTAISNARTPVGSRGEITWHEIGDDVIGYLPGQEGCFRIGITASLPEFWPAAPIVSSPRVDEDIVISAAMPGEDPSPVVR